MRSKFFDRFRYFLEALHQVGEVFLLVQPLLVECSAALHQQPGPPCCLHAQPIVCTTRLR